MTPATLVAGGNAIDREAAIAQILVAHRSTAILLEGMPSGNSPLDDWQGKTGFSMHRIAAGCPCCVGNLTMRVMLNRLLKQAPEHLYISLATSSHLPQVRDLLIQTPYSHHIRLTDDWLI